MSASSWTSFRPAVIHLCTESCWAPCSVMWSSQPVQVTSAAVGDWTGWVEGYENTPEEPAEAPTTKQIVQVSNLPSRTCHRLTGEWQASSASWTGSVPSSSSTFNDSSYASSSNVTSTGCDIRSDEREPLNFEGSRPAARNQHDFRTVSVPESLGKPRQGSSMLFPRPNHPLRPERASDLSTSTSPWRAVHDSQPDTPIADPNASNIPIHAPLPVRTKNLKSLQSPARTPVNQNHSPLPWQKCLPPGAPPVILTMFQVGIPAPNKKRRVPETKQSGSEPWDSGPSKRSKNKR